MRLIPKILCVLLALPALGLPLQARAEQDDLKSLSMPESRDWKVVRKDNRRNIVTYSKLEDDKSVRSFRVEATYDNSFDAAARHQLDIANYKNWFMNMDEAKIIKKVSDTEYYYYFKLRAPMGVPPRDGVVRVQIEPYTPARGSLVIRYNGAPDYIPAKPGVVRMPEYVVTTRLTPLGANKTQEISEGYAHPGGVAPTWMVNFFQRQMPYNNLLGRARDIPNYEKPDPNFEYRYKD